MRLVLMPGLDGTGRLFGPLVQVVGAHRCVVTAFPAEARTADDHVRAVALPDEPFALIAESFSGPLAITLAARRPPRLAALVLVATFARPPLGALLRLASRAGWAMPLAPRALVRWALLGGGAEPDLGAQLARTLASVPPLVVGARLRLLSTLDVRHELARLAVPVLVLEASDDRVVPSRLTRELSALAPRARHVVLPGPHLLLQRAPALAAAELESFVRALEPSG